MAPAGTMQIGQVAQRVGLSLRTVRYYEEQGLIVPERRTDGGFRLYTDHQVERLALIRQMKPLGFSLEEMRTLLAAREVLHDDDATAPERVEARLRLNAFADAADERCAQMRRQLAESEHLAAGLRHEAAPAGA